uniref:Uncharacterized protein n=1 Tax=Salvator merianae TaxID=96440 RepID=A0A8D0DT74_SALMN
MASLQPPPDPIEDTLCPICKDTMKNPVSVNCGHNFCEDCIDQYFVTWAEAGKKLCPVCRTKIKKESIRRNWQLKSIVEKIIFLSQSTGKGDLCATHKEKRLLFCKEDKELMCWVCEKSVKHKNHSVLPLEEAAPLYREEIMKCLKTLREKRKEVLSYKADTEKERQDLLVSKEKMVTTFKELYQYLEEQEKHLLAQMEEVMEEIERRKKNYLEQFAEDLRSLGNTIQEMEEKLHQPAVDLLQVSPGDISERKGPLTSVSPCFSFLNFPTVNVHLDPETAHPQLIVSEDCKRVRWTEKWQDVPDNPERFDFWPCVLGREEFTGGRHFWEVIVGPGEWAVGVARKSLERKGKITWRPKGGTWIMEKWRGAYLSYSNDSCIFLSPNEEPRKIRVALNYEKGQVAFYDADRGTQICEYSGVPFTRETLCPFCYLCGNAHLTFSF